MKKTVIPDAVLVIGGNNRDHQLLDGVENEHD